MHTTTILNFDQDSNFNIDDQGRIINTNALTHIKDNLYQFEPNCVIFEDNKAVGDNVIVRRELCNIKASFYTSEQIEFYIWVSSNTIPYDSQIICIPGSAYKIDDYFSVVHLSAIIFWYENNKIVMGKDFLRLEADLNIYGNTENSGLNENGVRFHFTESQYKLTLNDKVYHIVKKEDVLICE